MSILNAFTNQIVHFFDELCSTFPEEKDIKMAAESVKGAKKINPRLLLNLFVEYVYNPCSKAIYEKNIHIIRHQMHVVISSQFNDMMVILTLFDKHWETMGENNRDIIWQYLKVLCLLSEKATASNSL